MANANQRIINFGARGGTRIVRGSTAMLSKATGSKAHSYLVQLDGKIESNEAVRSSRRLAMTLVSSFGRELLANAQQIAFALGFTESEIVQVATDPVFEGSGKARITTPVAEGMNNELLVDSQTTISCVRLIVNKFIKDFESMSGIPADNIVERAQAAVKYQTMCLSLRRIMGWDTALAGYKKPGQEEEPNGFAFVNFPQSVISGLISANHWMKTEGGSSGQHSSATLIISMINNLNSAIGSGVINPAMLRAVGGTDEGTLSLTVCKNIAQQAIAGSRKFEDERGPAREFLDLLEHSQRDPTVGEMITTVLRNNSASGQLSNKMSRDHLMTIVYMQLKSWFLVDGGYDWSFFSLDPIAISNRLQKLGYVHVGSDVSKSSINIVLNSGPEWMKKWGANVMNAQLNIHSPLHIVDSKRMADDLQAVTRCPSSILPVSICMSDPMQALTALAGLAKIEAEDAQAKIHSSGHSLMKMLTYGLATTCLQNPSESDVAYNQTQFAFCTAEGGLMQVIPLYSEEVQELQAMTSASKWNVSTRSKRAAKMKDASGAVIAGCSDEITLGKMAAIKVRVQDEESLLFS